MITEADAKQFYAAIRFGAAKADVPERDVFCMFLAVVWESINDSNPSARGIWDGFMFLGEEPTIGDLIRWLNKAPGSGAGRSSG